MIPYPMLNPLQILSNASHCDRCGKTSAAIEIEAADDPLLILPSFKLAESVYCRYCGKKLPEIIPSAIKAALARQVANALQLPSSAPKALPPAPPSKGGPATKEEKAQLIAEAEAEVNGHAPKKPKPAKKAVKKKRGFGSATVAEYRPELPHLYKTPNMVKWSERGRDLPDGNYEWIKGGQQGPIPVVVDPHEQYRSEQALHDYVGSGLRRIFIEARDKGHLKTTPIPGKSGKPIYVIIGKDLIDWLEKLVKIGQEEGV